MYYNNNDKILVRRLPKNLLKEDGSLLIDFHLSSPEVLSDYGFYIVRNDNSVAPVDCIGEDVDKRVVVIEKPYADVFRTWI